MKLDGKDKKVSPYLEVCLGALIGLGLSGVIVLIIGKSFQFNNPYTYSAFITGIIGLFLCLNGIRRI